MKTRLSIVLSILILSLALQGCVGTVVRGSGRLGQEERSVSGFHEVALAGQGTLHIEVGRQEALRIEAEKNLMRYLKAQVDDDRLRIGIQNGVTLRNTQPIHYYLTVTDLDTLVLSGSGTILAPDLEANSFAVTISGSGNIEMDDLEANDVRFRISGSGDLAVEKLDAEVLEVRLSGSGDLEVADGEAKEQAITISGAGKYVARELESEDTTARVTGSGTATVQVSESLDAHVSGSGNVNYLGQPVIDTRVTGSGDVRQIGG